MSKRLLALRGDSALVERVRTGDPAAFEVLYERHVPAILSFCRHMLGSHEEAEDAVQQAFVSAHRSLRSGEREINLKPWLFAIARNRCLSMLRARRETAVEEVDVSTRGLAEVVEERADLRSLLTDMADLPEDQRAALVLTELGDLSHADVAGVLGCGVGQVKGLVFRARAGLAERREAREARCEDIRVELANARGGGVRRGRLRHHVKACASCAAFEQDLRRQRKLMALVLPVAPTVGLKDSVLGAVAATGTGAVAGSAVAGGGVAATAAGLGAAGGATSMAAATVAKLAAVGLIAGGAGVAAVAGGGDDAPAPMPAPSIEAPARAPGAAPEPTRSPRAPSPAGNGQERPAGLRRDGAARRKERPDAGAGAGARGGRARRDRGRAGRPKPGAGRDRQPASRGGAPPTRTRSTPRSPERSRSQPAPSRSNDTSPAGPAPEASPRLQPARPIVPGSRTPSAPTASPPAGARGRGR